MYVGNVVQRTEALLREYLKPLGMLVEVGPLRVLRELTQGIIFTGSVQLSNAARLFCHTPGDLAHAVKRMSEHLSDRHFNHGEWSAAVLELLCDAVQDDDLIPIDATELAKPYARHMQYQCVVRDASRVGDPLVSGYWCLGAWHWQEEVWSLAPLMLRPYSPNQPGYLSENDLLSRWFWTLRQAMSGRGIWLMDRGGDRPEIFAELLRVQPRWIVRLREDRALIGPDGTQRPAGVWADWALQHRNRRGHAVTLPVRLPLQDVRPYATVPSLWLEVPTYRFGDNQRWVLLTCGLIDRHTGPRQVRHHYALRWRAEDGKRWLGQIWHVEQFLTRSFLALERMLCCVCLAGGFITMLQRHEPQLSQTLEQEVLYWNKSWKIPAYRITRGLQALATRRACATMLNNA
jgi:hypothetical protein